MTTTQTGYVMVPQALFDALCTIAAAHAEEYGTARPTADAAAALHADGAVYMAVPKSVEELAAAIDTFIHDRVTTWAAAAGLVETLKVAQAKVWGDLLDDMSGRHE